ncbi:SWIM zinc finger family protein [Granulosicoccus antarcticus]|uniref:SWIM-type domain-containing protein n=1 Tax=Granulosicoccus antarcticus IMCC3135 TaxID=1192854 RepID=A0A2Z2P438_9GAMM|nr:SWIM zinc finger family protein [Granulosicoccus antarcticus]ASJ76180.1 hypothetical protein IMCC3135_30655 [Granulosicoccus antarcticus IMCC3135]
MISPDQVTALAPDAASFKAGKALAVASKWTDLGHNETMLWGLAKGSGKNPYKTQVSVADFASKCSCPSRKFPCKHALGLMFIAAEDLSKLTTGDMPDWARDWLESRTERKEKAEKKKSTAKPKNEETAARSRQKRGARIDEGIDLLSSFLLDLMSQGLGQASLSDGAIWDDVARRLVDCQAPGLASHVRRFDEIAHASTNWEQRLLHEMGSLYLLLHGYRQRESLSDDLRAEVEQRIGWQLAKEDILKGHCLQDDWFVAYRTITHADKLTVFSNWLYGRNHQQWALMLSFGTPGSAPVSLWPVGSLVSTELAFYPGAGLERAIAVNESAQVAMDTKLTAPAESIRQLLHRVSVSLAANPWQTRFPCLIQVQPVMDGGRLMLVDDEAQALPWQASREEQLMVTAISGGQAIMLAGEWDGHVIRLHAADDQGTWFALREQF